MEESSPHQKLTWSARHLEVRPRRDARFVYYPLLLPELPVLRLQALSFRSASSTILHEHDSTLSGLRCNWCNLRCGTNDRVPHSCECTPREMKAGATAFGGSCSGGTNGPKFPATFGSASPPLGAQGTPTNLQKATPCLCAQDRAISERLAHRQLHLNGKPIRRMSRRQSTSKEP